MKGTRDKLSNYFFRNFNRLKGIALSFDRKQFHRLTFGRQSAEIHPALHL
jgi:hypothetical protein